MDKKQLAKIIHNMLSKQSFKDWLDKEFEDYITGEEDALSYQQILNDLEWHISSEIR